MHLYFDNTSLPEYKSPSQKIRFLSEGWVEKNIFCPSCGDSLLKQPNNIPVCDFVCSQCLIDFELKSKKGAMGNKIVDGAYTTMINKIKLGSQPNFFFLNYGKDFNITNFIVIPKRFFMVGCIERRKPLAKTAIRSGWIGCNILLSFVPRSGRIHYVRNGSITGETYVIDQWNKTKFLENVKNIQAKGWIIEIMACIDKLDTSMFSLSDMYRFEELLESKYPRNKHIKQKIRQQLQKLRDRGYIKFLGNGRYRKI